VAAGGGDLQRPLGGFLALDVGEVGVVRVIRRQLRLRPGQQLRSLEVVDQRQQVGRRQHGEVAGPRRLATLGGRADQAALAGIGVNGRRQHARHRGKPAVQRQLAQGHIAVHLVGRQRPHGGQHAQGDRQVEMAAFLDQVGRRQVDGDALGRQRQAQGVERGAHPLAAFSHRLVGQPDHGKGRQAGSQLHLDVDVQHLDAGEGDGTDTCDHANAPDVSLPF